VKLTVHKATHPELFQHTVTAFSQTTGRPSLFGNDNNININDSDSIDNNINSSVNGHTMTATDSISLLFGRHISSSTKTKNKNKTRRHITGVSVASTSHEDIAADSNHHTTALAVVAGTYYLPLCGSQVWYIRPDEAQDWCTDPPPVTMSVNRKEEALRVEVHSGDVLLINRQFWFHDTTCDAADDDDDDDDDDAPASSTSSEEDVGTGGLYFTVSRDFTYI
jgi:hypothetical protein